MTKRLTLLLAGGVACAVAGPWSARAATTSCSGLTGSYGLEVAGFTATEGKFLNGVVSFSSSCTLSGSVTIGENNTVQSFVGISGSYSNSATDSTISITLNIPGETAAETYQVAVSTFEPEAVGIETDASAVATISLQPQSYTGSYTDASLYGTFAVSCIGAASSSSDLNYVTFAAPTASSGGYGVISGVDYYHNGVLNGAVAEAPFVGLYGVGSNGAFGGEVSVGSTTISSSTSYDFGFSGVIDNDLNEIQYNYSTAGAAGYDNVACRGKRVGKASAN